VLRWSALGLGVFYGAYHQLSLSARDKAVASKKDWEHKESLIRQAKAEWARSHPEPKASGVFPHQFLDSVIGIMGCDLLMHTTGSANANDPNADLNTILGITDN